MDSSFAAAALKAARLGAQSGEARSLACFVAREWASVASLVDARRGPSAAASSLRISPRARRSEGRVGLRWGGYKEG